MPKSKRRKTKVQNRKPKKRLYKPYEVVKQNFVSFDNPFSEDIPFEERLHILVEIGKRSEINYQKQYLKLTDYFNEYDPLYLCAFCAYYFVRQEEGIDLEAINGTLEFPPFYLEILQCVSLIKERTISEKLLISKCSNIFREFME